MNKLSLTRTLLVLLLVQTSLLSLIAFGLWDSTENTALLIALP